MFGFNHATEVRIGASSDETARGALGTAKCERCRCTLARCSCTGDSG